MMIVPPLGPIIKLRNSSSDDDRKTSMTSEKTKMLKDIQELTIKRECDMCTGFIIEFHGPYR